MTVHGLIKTAASGTAVATVASLALLAPTTTAIGAAPAPSSEVKVSNACLTSVPDPGTDEPVQICYTLFKPAGAGPDHRVPFIIHSHGWGGSRTTDPAAFQKWLDAGYGVLSFDQRGFGESGGTAYVENPSVEGHDVRRLVNLVANLGWVKQDGAGDPRLGAIGGSYGGGYQFLGAFEELRVKGTPVFDALAPEITWNDLNTSLAPQAVVRTEWALALSAASLPSQSLPPQVYKALVEGAATGTYPDGSIPGTENLPKFFERNGPAWHVSQGRRLDIPVLFGQGTTDTLFNLQQGLDNWRTAITKGAREHSIFVGYNGGHTLPAVYPQGVDVASDPCSKQLAGGDFADLALRFMDEQLKGMTPDCRDTASSTSPPRPRPVRRSTPSPPTTRSPSATSPPPRQVARPSPIPSPKAPSASPGSAYLTGTMTALGLNNRAFYGLAVGTNPLDAKLVQNNVMPFNALEPVIGEPRRIELPAVAVDVPAGQTLYVVASPLSETFVGMGSRTPGAVLLQGTVAHLPLVPAG